jgi:hypothetical protein
MLPDKDMKDVKVDVRVNVTVDAASIALLLATTTMAWLVYKQNKQETPKLAQPQ